MSSQCSWLFVCCMVLCDAKAPCACVILLAATVVSSEEKCAQAFVRIFLLFLQCTLVNTLWMHDYEQCLFALPKPGEGPFKGWFALLNLILLCLLKYTSAASTQYDNAFPYNANLFSSQMYVKFSESTLDKTFWTCKNSIIFLFLLFREVRH